MLNLCCRQPVLRLVTRARRINFNRHRQPTHFHAGPMLVAGAGWAQAGAGGAWPCPAPARVLRGLSGNRLAAFQRISRLAAAMRARHVLRAGPRTRDVSPGSRSRTRCLGGWWLRGAGPAYLPGNSMSMHASGQATCGAPMCRGKGTTATGRPPGACLAKQRTQTSGPGSSVAFIARAVRSSAVAKQRTKAWPAGGQGLQFAASDRRHCWSI